MPANRLREHLQHIGVSSRVLDLVKPACDRCSICRQWTGPGARPKVSSALRTRTNEEVQMDLFFIGSELKFLHIIDVCSRFGLAWHTKTKTLTELTSILFRNWMRIFGPPENLTTDQEGALAHAEFGRW